MGAVTEQENAELTLRAYPSERRAELCRKHFPVSSTGRFRSRLIVNLERRHRITKRVTGVACPCRPCWPPASCFPRASLPVALLRHEHVAGRPLDERPTTAADRHRIAGFPGHFLRAMQPARPLHAHGWATGAAGGPSECWPYRSPNDFDEVDALFQRDATWQSVASLDDLALRLWDLR